VAEIIEVIPASIAENPKFQQNIDVIVNCTLTEAVLLVVLVLDGVAKIWNQSAVMKLQDSETNSRNVKSHQ